MGVQNMRPEPWLKHMIDYTRFSGLNTVDSEDILNDYEVVDLVNMDLVERGSVRRRCGIVHHKRKFLWGDITGKTWGEL